MHRLRTLSLLLGLAALSLAATPPLAAQEGDLGFTEFPNSGAPGAQEPFLRGLLALHSFEYHDARRLFREAQAADPGFAMAYWGEAMTYNHPIWLEEDLDAGRAVLERLGPMPDARRARAPTAREQGYLEAIEILFGEGDKRARDRAYAEAMRRLHEAYPDDLDAAAFFALALLGTCHEGRDTATYMRAAAVVEEVFARNPRHPGAVHYLIHAYDDPVHAPLGLRAARIYATVAPAAEHALHMPSHIFLALGMWKETADSNLASWQASLEKVDLEGLPHDRRGYHALSWLHYAHLQLGDTEEARRLLTLMADDAAASGSGRARGHLAVMRAAQVVDARSSTGLPASPSRDGLSPTWAGADLFANGYAAVAAGDVSAGENALDELRRLATPEESPAGGGGHAHGPTAGYLRVGPSGKAEAEVMALQLEALLHRARGRDGEALALLERAAVLDEGLAFGFGPPLPVKPGRELLGEVLLDLGRAREAQEQFERALARTPGRRLALAGLERARRAHDG